MNDLGLMSCRLQRCSLRLTQATEIHSCVGGLLDAATMMTYDFWIYDLAMMTDNIPSTIYISFRHIILDSSDSMSCLFTLINV